MIFINIFNELLFFMFFSFFFFRFLQYVYRLKIESVSEDNSILVEYRSELVKIKNSNKILSKLTN